MGDSIITEKQNDALKKIITALPADCRESYSQIAQYAISLGYMPVIRGKHEDYADFIKSKFKRTILKINANPDFRWIAMKFYALPAYTGIFQDSLDERLKYWNKLGYEARCFGCGRCDGTHGYICALPDGKQGFLCGFGVVPLPKFCSENIPEIKEALKVQDEFYLKQASI